MVGSLHITLVLLVDGNPRTENGKFFYCCNVCTFISHYTIEMCQYFNKPYEWICKSVGGIYTRWFIGSNRCTFKSCGSIYFSSTCVQSVYTPCVQSSPQVKFHSNGLLLLLLFTWLDVALRLWMCLDLSQEPFPFIKRFAYSGSSSSLLVLHVLQILQNVPWLSSLYPNQVNSFYHFLV